MNDFLNSHKLTPEASDYAKNSNLGSTVTKSMTLIGNPMNQCSLKNFMK